MAVRVYVKHEAIPDWFAEMLRGPVFYHLWFLVVINGLYLLLPLLRPLFFNGRNTVIWSLTVPCLAIGSAVPLVNQGFGSVIIRAGLSAYRGNRLFPDGAHAGAIQDECPDTPGAVAAGPGMPVEPQIPRGQGGWQSRCRPSRFSWQCVCLC
jgi:hypothetical protein